MLRKISHCMTLSSTLRSTRAGLVAVHLSLWLLHCTGEKCRQRGRSGRLGGSRWGVSWSQILHQGLESALVVKMGSLQSTANRIPHEAVHRIETSWHILNEWMNHPPIFFVSCFGTAGIQFCNCSGHRHSDISTSVALLQHTSGCTKEQSMKMFTLW